MTRRKVIIAIGFACAFAAIIFLVLPSLHDDVGVTRLMKPEEVLFLDAQAKPVSQSDFYADSRTESILLHGQMVGHSPRRQEDSIERDLRSLIRKGALMLPVDGQTKDIAYTGSCRLRDGRIFITGGSLANKPQPGKQWIVPGDPIETEKLGDHTWFFDPKTKRIEEGPTLLVSRSRHDATVLSNGNVLLSGGEFNGELRSELELVDPIKRKDKIAGSLLVPRLRHSTVELKDGVVLITGGLYGRNQALTDSIESFQPKSGKSAIIGRLRNGRCEHYSLPYRDGAVIFGGWNNQWNDNPADDKVGSVEVYPGK